MSDKELYYLSNLYPNVARALQDTQANESTQLTVLRAVHAAAPRMLDYYELDVVSAQLPEYSDVLTVLAARQGDKP